MTLAGKVINNEDLLSGTSIMGRVSPMVITCSNCCFVIYDMVINFFATLRLIISSSVLVIFGTVRLDSISNRTVQNKEGSVNSMIYKSILIIQTSCFPTLLSAISFNFRDTPSFVILSSR